MSKLFGPSNVFRQEVRMKCPHCLVAFTGEWDHKDLGWDVDGPWALQTTKCPTCERFVIRLLQFEIPKDEEGFREVVVPQLKAELPVWPKATSRNPVPLQVTKRLASDYVEA